MGTTVEQRGQRKKIRKLEDRTITIIQSEKQRKKRLKKKKKRTEETLWPYKRSNTLVAKVPEGKEKESGQKKYIKK